jgi:uncharacterized OsmC-like protein
MTQSVINGVDTARLQTTIAAIQSDPQIAGFQFRVANRWEGGGLNRSRIEGYFGAKEELSHAKTFELVNDEPPVLLSGDKGPNPVENLLHALAGCLTTTLVYHAAARGIEVRGVSTRLEGDLDLHGFLGLSDKVRRGFSEINVSFEIDADMDDKNKRELIAIAQRYSPVFDVVTNGAPVIATLDAEETVRTPSTEYMSYA